MAIDQLIIAMGKHKVISEIYEQIFFSDVIDLLLIKR